ncbi:MAG: hypothetical protein PHO37_18945, partial [Kiritimatiellae bacterium]|nr:hypothetical protein [Kiritimatiellia bacterium]
DPGSLSLVFENGTNFVTQWRDTRTNGVTAFAAADAPRPFLRENFQNGLPVVDFGSFHYPGLNIMGYGGYLNWSESCTGIREGFMVFSDTPDTAAIPSNVNSSFLLGHNSLYGFHRGFEGALLIDPYASANLRNGSWNVDGQTVSFSHQLAAGFHLISFATTGPVTASRFARDRQSSAGGQRLAEVLIYTNVLSAGFRQGMQSHLLGKWKNQARSFAQVRATGGSMITLAAGVMDIALLEGSGAVKASRIAVDLLSPGDVAGQVGALSVTGDLDFNDGAVVTIDCIPPACDSIDVDGMLSIMGGGTFVFSGSVGTGIPEPVAVFTFDTVTGAENLKNWSVMGEVTAHYVVKPRIVGNQLMLIFLPKGTVILIR